MDSGGCWGFDVRLRFLCHELFKNLSLEICEFALCHESLRIFFAFRARKSLSVRLLTGAVHLLAISENSSKGVPRQ